MAASAAHGARRGPVAPLRRCAGHRRRTAGQYQGGQGRRPHRDAAPTWQREYKRPLVGPCRRRWPGTHSLGAVRCGQGCLDLKRGRACHAAQQPVGQPLTACGASKARGWVCAQRTARRRWQGRRQQPAAGYRLHRAGARSGGSSVPGCGGVWLRCWHGICRPSLGIRSRVGRGGAQRAGHKGGASEPRGTAGRFEGGVGDGRAAAAHHLARVERGGARVAAGLTRSLRPRGAPRARPRGRTPRRAQTRPAAPPGGSGPRA